MERVAEYLMMQIDRLEDQLNNMTCDHLVDEFFDEIADCKNMKEVKEKIKEIRADYLCPF